MEGFSSYEHLRLIVFLEWVGRLTGNLLIIAGILLFLFIYISSHPPQQS
jgi:heme A synthase